MATNSKKKSDTAAKKTPAVKKGLKKGSAGPKAGEERQRRRLWLMYPQKLIKVPVIWELGRKFEVVTNIRQASLNGEIGIVALELEGRREEIKAAIKWMEGLGVGVDPVEINVIES